jgi:hypothetical protein
MEVRAQLVDTEITTLEATYMAVLCHLCLLAVVYLEIDPFIVLFSTQEGRKVRILLFFLFYFLLSPPILTT